VSTRRQFITRVLGSTAAVAAGSVFSVVAGFPGSDCGFVPVQPTKRSSVNVIPVRQVDRGARRTGSALEIQMCLQRVVPLR